MQSHQYGTWHPTLHGEEIRVDYQRANGPAALHAPRSGQDRFSRPLIHRLRGSWTALAARGSRERAWPAASMRRAAASSDASASRGSA